MIGPVHIGLTLGTISSGQAIENIGIQFPKLPDFHHKIKKVTKL
jgi:hypothetical protein